MKKSGRVDFLKGKERRWGRRGRGGRWAQERKEERGAGGRGQREASIGPSLGPPCTRNRSSAGQPAHRAEAQPLVLIMDRPAVRSTENESAKRPANKSVVPGRGQTELQRQACHFAELCAACTPPLSAAPEEHGQPERQACPRGSWWPGQAPQTWQQVLCTLSPE